MKLIPKAFLKTIGTVGAQERLTPSDLLVPSVQLQAERSNTGSVYVGDSQVSSTNYGVELQAGDVITLSAKDLGWGDAEISLRDIWLDVSVAGDGVAAIFLDRG